ncbi:MAG: hypothetical protein ABW210_14630 [Achromobacter sp.]
MSSITIDRRFCGPPNSGNGGYVSGLLARHFPEGAVVTLRAPPPLERPLGIRNSDDGAVELHEEATLLAQARAATLDVADVPLADFAEAEDAMTRTPLNECNHSLPNCFVCGPKRAPGDGLRIQPGPLAAREGRRAGTFAAAWVPYDNLAGDDGRVASEFVWAALDCPTAYAGLAARHLGVTGAETILLGRMSARIDARPHPGERCVIVAWPTGRDGRKLFADSALLSAGGDVLAVARATWLSVDRAVQLGETRGGS